MQMNEQLVINDINIDLKYKRIKYIHLVVTPPDGRVQVSAPIGVSKQKIKLFVLSKYIWLKNKIEQATSYTYQSQRQYVSGEAHYFKGHLYRLKVVVTKATKQQVYVQGDYLVVNCLREQNVEALIKSKYRAYLKELLEQLISTWSKRLNVNAPSFEIRQMKKRWGSCNKNKLHTVFNLELAKKSLDCINYVVVHEMIHLIENNHSDRFYNLLNKHMPMWKDIQARLNEQTIN